VPSLIIALALVFVKPAAAYETGGIMFYRLPKACQCFPANPLSKVYLSEKRTMFGEKKIFTCEFTCLGPNREVSQLMGTQEDSYLFWDNGDHFVCRGYVMKFQHTPYAKDRLGYLKIGGIKPFPAAGSKIPELEVWATGAGCR